MTFTVVRPFYVVGGDGKVCGRDESLPYKSTAKRSTAVSRGPGMPGPYGLLFPASGRLIRDKVQDLQDEKAGINVSYEADFAKAKKKWKQKRKEKRLEQTKRKIVQKGWESLNDTEQRFMKKRLSAEQIEALQQEWVTANEHKDEAEQLTLDL